MDIDISETNKKLNVIYETMNFKNVHQTIKNSELWETRNK